MIYIFTLLIHHTCEAMPKYGSWDYFELEPEGGGWLTFFLRVLHLQGEVEGEARVGVRLSQENKLNSPFLYMGGGGAFLSLYGPFLYERAIPANNETKLCLRCMPVICRHCRQRISIKNMPQNC